MKNEIESLLNDLLAQWHRWASGYRHCAGVGTSPMFRDARTSRGWDSVSDIVDSEIDGGTMEAVNFHVNELSPAHRTALQLQARNLYTGASVWSSPRLPQDPQARAMLLGDARSLLLKRLLAAGVI